MKTRAQAAQEEQQAAAAKEAAAQQAQYRLEKQSSWIYNSKNADQNGQQKHAEFKVQYSHLRFNN